MSNVTYLTNHNLPTALERYANGDDVLFPLGRFTKEEVRLAKWLRKGAFRRIQQTQPGLQYQFADYESLMRSEINEFAKRVLRKKCFEKWDELVLVAPRLQELYEAIRKTQTVSLSPTKTRNQILEARRQAFHDAILDPRTLGEIELFAVKKICYGMPKWRNYDAKQDG